MPRTILATSLLACAAIVSPAFAQVSNINGANKYCWAENAGWINWRDAGDPIGAQGVVVGTTFLSGFAWSENTGWINFGNGAPADGAAYANTNGPDSGINIAPDGALSGFAWGENIGWINFSLPSLPAIQQPRLDYAARRFRGYAWSENLGWLNLDIAEEGKFVAVRTCPADFNDDGTLDPDDLADYIGAFFAVPPGEGSDFNNDGTTDPDDLADYIGAFFNGCG